MGKVSLEKTKTIKNKIISHGAKTFEPTIAIYWEALAFIADVIQKEFDHLKHLNTKQVVPAVEKLIHRTKTNPFPKYPFTDRFYKFPSYFRRAAITKAFGDVKSYYSNLENWKNERAQALAQGKRFTKKPPVFRVDHHAFPVFYKGNMFQRLSKNQAQIKIYQNNDWIWETITFDDKNFKNRGIKDWKEHNPMLVRTGKKYFLHFSYSKKIPFKQTKLKEQVIVAVDLGLTNSAVCSAIRFDGTVIGRKFINQPIEKDRFKTKVNKLKKAQSRSGLISAPNYWRRINGLQKHIIHHTASEIVKFAEKVHADVIVFEYLGKMKMPKGMYGAKKLRQKLHHWCKMGIQHKVEEMAHYRGMRIRRVNAKNTSALAFDGSGKVVRNGKKDLAVFPTGKIYHADLNASYNIGARYFLREILKSFSEKERLQWEAKVPSLAARTRQTLSSLISLHQALNLEGVTLA
jgi:putative transposase